MAMYEQDKYPTQMLFFAGIFRPFIMVSGHIKKKVFKFMEGYH